MSKANAKATHTTAEEAPAPAPQAPTDSGATAVVSASPPTAPGPDQHTGKGGLYTRVNGVRQLVERTGRTEQPAEDPQTDTATAKE